MQSLTTQAASDRTVIKLGAGLYVDDYLRSSINSQLMLGSESPKELPSCLLSDHEGQKLWSVVTETPEYYLTRAEIELFETYGDELSEYVQDGTTIFDLGCGNLRKIAPLLSKLSANGRTNLQYYALDLSYSTLQSALAELPEYPGIKCTGLCGSFSDALLFASDMKSLQPRIFMSLGSIFGNGSFRNALGLLKPWASIMKAHDRMLIAMDATQDFKKVYECYNDSKGSWYGYLRNGLVQSNRLVGANWYHEEQWDVRGECYTALMIDDKGRHGEPALRHRLTFRSNTVVVCEEIGLDWPEGTEIINESYRYTPADMVRQFDAADLKVEKMWKAPGHEIYQYLTKHDNGEENQV